MAVYQMKIITVQFDFEGTMDYTRLLRVFEKSVARYMPNAKFISHRIPAPEVPVNVSHTHFTSNTVKLEIWKEEMDRADEPIVFADCDMLATGDLSTIFGHKVSETILYKPWGDFDVALTDRYGQKYPINGGMVYANPTDKAREFFALWAQANRRLYEDPQEHKIWREKYAGMNQASLGLVLEKYKFDAKVVKVPCSTWNACDADWINFDTNVKVCHIKGRMRRAVLSQMQIADMQPHLRKIADIWRTYERPGS
jgi:hypothetical protein